MNKEDTVLTPNQYICFIGGCICGISFYIGFYLLYYYFKLPIQRILGPIENNKIEFGVLIYIGLYILFFWGIFIIIYKKGLINFENKAIVEYSDTFQKSIIIDKRSDLDNLRNSLTLGIKSEKYKKSILNQILLFLIDHCLVTLSSDRIMEIFSKRIDTLQNQIEASYNILRYIAWAIPSLGFIGTVLGIGTALSKAGMAIENIELVTKPLGVAFDTTLIALIESMILMFLIYNTQQKEEKLLNKIDLFCQERFIINLSKNISKE